MDNRLNLVVNFAQKGLNQLQGGLKNLVGLGRTGSQAMRDMARETRGLERELAAVRRELAGASGNVTALIDRERALERAVDQANAKLKRQAALVKVDEQVAAMRARGDELVSRGRGNVVTGAAMLVPFALAARAGMAYDKQLALLAQKTDLNRRETRAFGADLLLVARQAKLMPDVVVSGADFLASKGLGVAEIRATLPAIAQFGRAWDADVVDSAKAAYANYLSLKVPLNQTARALEIMGVAGKEGGFEVRDMAEHFPVLASSLATFGAKGLGAVSSLAAALQVLEAKTGDGALAANDLANVLQFVRTEQGQKKFKKFGIDIVAELKKAEKDGGDALERLVELTRKVTGGDDSKIATIFSDAQAGRGALNLVQSIDTYRKIRDEAFAAQGVTAKEFARMSETAEANWDSARGAVAGLAATLGTNLLPLLTRGINAFARVTNGVADWAAANPRAASTLMMVVGGLGAARIGVGVLQIALGALFGPLSSVLGLILKYRAVGSLALLFPKVALAARGLGIAFRFMLGPWGLAITLIGLVAYAVYTNWDKIKNAFTTGVAWIGGTLRRFGPMVLAALGPIGLLVGLVIRNWDGIKAAFVSGWQKVKAFFAGLPAEMKAFGKNMIVGLLTFLNPAVLTARLLSIARSGVTAFKNFFGIKSPSRLFMTYGGHMAQGLAIGIDRRREAAFASARRLAVGVAGAAAISTAGPLAAASQGGRAPASVAAPAPIVINIYQQPGESADDLAKRLERMLDARERRRAADRRSEYGDS